MSNLPFTAALLAGGKSSRMGRDKATLEWMGQPMWRRQIQLLESLQPDQLLISGRPDGPYVGSEYRVVFDSVKDLGPLAGLKSLLEVCTTGRLLVLAVDMPWMKVSTLAHLLSFGGGVVPSIDGWSEGAAAVYPVEILGAVDFILESEDRSFQKLIRLALSRRYLGQWEVSSQLQPCFRSWNSPDGGSPLPKSTIE